MKIWQAIIYGIIQGATEFLPVSSSGHLIFFNSILGQTDNFLLFTVLLHLATLFAVIIVLRKQILYLIKNPFCAFAKKLYISTAITVVLVLLFQNTLLGLFSDAFLPINFCLTAALLITTELYRKKRPHKISYRASVFMGLAQTIAVIPGISRSGATICAGLLEGSEKSECAEFSFIMSIPIILASLLFEIFFSSSSGAASTAELPILPTIIAFITALIIGVLCIKLMLKLVKKVKLYPFAIYLIIIAIVSLFVI